MNKNTYIAIGLCLALFILVVALDHDTGRNHPKQNPSGLVTQEVTPASKKNPDTDKAMLVTHCELAIKPQLKNPKSFDIDMHQTRVYDHEGSIVLDMFYYAENGYGATSINEAFCEFTQSGNLINVMPVP